MVLVFVHRLKILCPGILHRSFQLLTIVKSVKSGKLCCNLYIIHGIQKPIFNFLLLKCHKKFFAGKYEIFAAAQKNDVWQKFML